MLINLSLFSLPELLTRFRPFNNLELVICIRVCSRMFTLATLEKLIAIAPADVALSARIGLVNSTVDYSSSFGGWLKLAQGYV